MVKTVAVICRANQVRSRVAEAVLLQDYPDMVVKSFGTSVADFANVDQSFVGLMSHWGLDLSHHKPRSVDSELEFIVSADLVVAVDDRVLAQIGRLNKRTVNLLDYAIDLQHSPVDPAGMAKDTFLQNVAKIIHCTRRLSDTFEPTIPQSNRIILLVPKSEEFHFLQEPDSFYVNASFIKPNYDFKQHAQLCSFEESRIADRSILSLVNPESRHYEARFEFNAPEKVLNSPAWKEFIRKVSSFGPTYVITEPLMAGGIDHWKPYLATYLADEVRYL
jgi:protein-tyrosine-phosphatase